jgi:hypothetical protein
VGVGAAEACEVFHRHEASWVKKRRLFLKTASRMG